MHLSLLIASVLLAVCNAAPQKLLYNAHDLSDLPTTVECSPNPIATLYPGSVTGTINGTIAVVPIPYLEARSIIPSQYGILTHQYESILPGFPAGHYPLIIRSVIDHDIIFDAKTLVPDFQVCSSLQSRARQPANKSTSPFTSSILSLTCSEMAILGLLTRKSSS
jgi:hypothetical protein